MSMLVLVISGESLFVLISDDEFLSVVPSEKRFSVVDVVTDDDALSVKMD